MRAGLASVAPMQLTAACALSRGVPCMRRPLPLAPALSASGVPRVSSCCLRRYDHTSDAYAAPSLYTTCHQLSTGVPTSSRPVTGALALFRSARQCMSDESTRRRYDKNTALSPQTATAADTHAPTLAIAYPRHRIIAYPPCLHTHAQANASQPPCLHTHAHRRMPHNPQASTYAHRRMPHNPHASSHTHRRILRATSSTTTTCAPRTPRAPSSSTCPPSSCRGIHGARSWWESRSSKRTSTFGMHSPIGTARRGPITSSSCRGRR